MVQALIQLLRTKSLSNITISELTERAGVSRMTYYRNYSSMDEIFTSYLKDLVDAYRQDVAAWPDKGNYNDYRNMLHCYEYFDHYREFIACLVNTGLGQINSAWFGLDAVCSAVPVLPAAFTARSLKYVLFSTT